MSKRILLLFSDTGGGHRAAAEAIRDALKVRHPDNVQIEMVDVFRQYTPFPYKYAPEMYPWMINNTKSSWAVTYQWTNNPQVASVIEKTVHPSMRSGLRRLFRENPSDVVVCVHSLLTRPLMSTLARLEERPPYVVVVTDLVSTHAFWYDTRADRTLVPTQSAFDVGIENGLEPAKMRVTGLPVHADFSKRLKDKAAARAELGWEPGLPAILMVGGGEGMGPLYKTARAVNDLNARCQIAVIAGRNADLKANLESSDWNQPTHIYPFVTNMPVLMAAADVLVTKGGPATISEACIAGLPVIIYDAIPGQETGNVEFVVKNDAGIFAPSPEEVAGAVRKWLGDGPEGLAKRSANARELGQPDAVWTIADEVWEYAHRPIIRQERKRPSLRRLLR
jgi:1,2-diacylglycerol 3-beta-galactosyltransferase